VPDGDLPSIPPEDGDEGEGQPMTGPFWWERRTRSQEVSWMEGRQSHQGIAIRDTEDDEAYICSTLYTPDIRGMI
jgi:hypothetical protein